ARAGGTGSEVGAEVRTRSSATLFPSGPRTVALNGVSVRRRAPIIPREARRLDPHGICAARMRNIEDMSEPALAPRNPFGGVVFVWGAAFVAAVASGIFVAEELRVQWLLVGFGGAVLRSFALQLWYGQTSWFIFRTAP